MNANAEVNRFPATPTACLLALICLIGASATGCNDKSRDVGKRVRHHVVETVVDQGVTLDESAGPEEVVYVLLRAIVDDYAAGKDAALREAAFDRQLALCAPDHIFSRTVRKSFGREEGVQRIVWRWAPVLGHYRGDFPADLESAKRRLVTVRQVKDDDGRLERARVELEVASPDEDPNASVVAQFQLVREGGYLRVAQVGFVKGRRHITSARTAVVPTQAGPN